MSALTNSARDSRRRVNDTTRAGSFWCGTWRPCGLCARSSTRRGTASWRSRSTAGGCARPSGPGLTCGGATAGGAGRGLRRIARTERAAPAPPVPAPAGTSLATMRRKTRPRPPGIAATVQVNPSHQSLAEWSPLSVAMCIRCAALDGPAGGHAFVCA